MTSLTSLSISDLRRRDAVVWLAAVALAGCASRGAPPRRLYALTGTPPLPDDRQPGRDNRAWVLSPQVRLPELLDRDEILVAEGSAGLRPLPEARWAEPLRESLPRLLTEDLWRLRQPYPVTLGKPNAPDGESLRLVVQVDEWLARPDGAGLQLRLRARWHWLPLQAPGGTTLPTPHAADISLPSSAQADALADAYRRSVTLLAARIVAAS
ncbi:membrane integrity-associated transporter subunit PqiC [Roseateles sp. DC23W]|uniref:Membrane integrity-associated transporter subunit PqiC n=1 Tax=Pelomonas dachongensis TaxID=3299029 RepID=A0ABW7EG03_9BURK